MSELYTLNSYGNAELTIDDIKYEIITDTNIILNTLDDYSNKLAQTNWRIYFNVKASDVKNWLLKANQILVNSEISAGAKCLKTNRYVGFDLGLDYYEGVNL